jgi:subtilisin family serine protease
VSGDGGFEGLAAEFIGPVVQRAGDRVFIPLVGTGFGQDTVVRLRQGPDAREATLERTADRVLQFGTATSAGDCGCWDVVVTRGAESLVIPEAIRLVDNCLRTAFDDFSEAGGDYVRGVIGVKVRDSSFVFPSGQRFAGPLELGSTSPALLDALLSSQVHRVEKVFPGTRHGDPRCEALTRFFRFWFPPSLSTADVLAALDGLPEIDSAWWYEPGTPCTTEGMLHPDDPLYAVAADTAQWNLYQWAEQYSEVADVDMLRAWDLLGVATENMRIAILDMGLRYTHEDMGGTTDFPNWLSPCGYDMVLDVEDPMEEPYVDEEAFCQRAHGTRVSSVAAAATDNAKGIAAAGWGTTKLAPFKICDSDSPQYYYTLKMPDAVRRAVDDCGVDAINVSYVSGRTEDMGAAVEYAHSVGGVFFTASTGNQEAPSGAPYYPAAYPFVTGVTQTTRDACWGDAWWMTQLHYPSTYCPTNPTHCDSSGAHPVWLTDLAAPGGHMYDQGFDRHEIIVADAKDDSSYRADSGTSLAAPLVASIGVYLKDRAQARGVHLYPEDIEGLLCATAEPVAVMNPDGTCSDDFYEQYPNTYCGWGKVNAYEAARRVEGSFPDRQFVQSTIRRFTAAGFDTCWQDYSFRYANYPQVGDTTVFDRYRLRMRMAYDGYTYDGTPFAWGYCASYENRGSYGDPRRYPGYNPVNIDVDEMRWKWSGVIPGSMGHDACTVESFLWHYVTNDSDSGWVTIPPDSMIWACGVSGWHIFSSVDPENTVASKEAKAVVETNCPNPFNPTTSITLYLPSREHLWVRIYDVHGRLARTLLDQVVEPGRRSLEWDGLDNRGVPVASGVYFLRVNSASFEDTKKMVLVR